MSDTSPNSAAKTFTGLARRKTRRSVKIIDAIAKHVITTGGISVTIAFVLIVVALVRQVLPLFGTAHVLPTLSVQLPQPSPGPGAAIRGMALDEYLNYVWTINASGALDVYRTAGGELIKSESLSDKPVTAVSVSRNFVSVGRNDGTVKVGQIAVDVTFPDKKSDAMESLQPGQTMMFDGGIATINVDGQIKVFHVTPRLSDPLPVGNEPSPILHLDYMKFGANLEAFAAMREDGRLYFSTITYKGLAKKRATAENFELPVPKELKGKEVAAVLIGSNARMVYVVYPDGRSLRYNTDNPEKFAADAPASLRNKPGSGGPIEEVDLLPDPSAKLASIRLLLGNSTLIVADTRGNVSGWFAAPYPPNEPGPIADQQRMVRAHELKSQNASVTTIATSARDRQFLTGDSSGHFVLRHMTSQASSDAFATQGGAAIEAAAIAPNNSAVAVLNKTHHLTLLGLDNPHPEATAGALFGKVHYENYPAPDFVYQSSAAGDDAEPKFSLIPLIWGTFKATFYAMLVAVPIAILAAIYTSEFMQPQVRAIVKPTVELMASLPSVVLGFVAALVFAPLVENWLMAVLAMFVALPVGMGAFGFFWQLLPVPVALRVPQWMRFLIMILLVLVIGFLTHLAGPFLEKIIFYGDVRDWLSGKIASPTPGWLVLLTPLVTLVLIFTYNTHIKSRIRGLLVGRTVGQLGAIEILRFVLIAAIAIVLALLMGWGLGSMGFDVRKELPGFGSILGPYAKLNSLLVGIFMGFAIIPLIYTVSEDALSSVPGSLRSASLGAGATPWQTAIRVVLPVATSGIFSACMIGFGRAAGETMIVLMASGRTPLIDISPFNGLSALSANVATEMPEAMRNSTHYRILFLSGLVLFGVTFMVNTAAEIVRIRFRKRAYQL